MELKEYQNSAARTAIFPNELPSCIDCPFCGSSNVGGVALTSHDYWCNDCKSEFKESYIKRYADPGGDRSDE